MADTRDLVLGTAGHIDHGKTALVRALTGIDTDRLPAEKQRGITIDLGFAALELEGYRLALVDVPGHERFIRNMLAGATGLDLVLLVVAADDSIMPQTREHLAILRLLDLSAGVVAMSKCDLVDDEWLALVEDDVRQLVVGTFLEAAPIVRTATPTGLGIESLRAALHAACVSVAPRGDSGLFRMSVDRAFTIAGHGTVATGTVASGAVRVGDELELWPKGRTVRVRGLQRHDQPADRIGRGARAAINLVGVHHSELRRGQELAAPGYLEASRILSVELRVAPDAPRPPRHRQRYKLHIGTAEVVASLALLDGDGTDPSRPALAQLMLAEPIAAVAGQPFILREESPPTTLGGGHVLQPTARRVRRRDSEGLLRIDRMRDASLELRAVAALTHIGLRPWTTASLARETGLPIEQVGPARERLAANGALVEIAVGPRRVSLVAAGVVAEMETRLLRTLARLHESHPRQSAIRRGELAVALRDLGGEHLIAGLLERLRAAGKVTVDERTAAVAGHEPRLSHAERKLKQEIAGALRAGAFNPPDQAELAARAGRLAGAVPELLQLLADEGVAVEVGGGIWLSAEAESELRRRVRERLSAPSETPFTMAGLRDLLGTTRKFAVPIGEYLDRLGLTRRIGDARVLNAAPEVASPGA
jgi:selenocysteine-specific elongation factor